MAKGYSQQHEVDYTEAFALVARMDTVRMRFFLGIEMWQNLTKDGAVELGHCGTQDQVADLMTKPLKLDAFKKLSEQLLFMTSDSLNINSNIN